MALVICPLHAVRGIGINTCWGIKKIHDKLQHWLWASIVCCHGGKAQTEPGFDYYCSWYWFGKTQGSHRSNKPEVMKSATLGFLCYKSCSSVPRLDSCRGKRIVSISQAGSWADRDSPHIRARSLVGALLVYLGSSGFKNVLFYKADLVRGCLIANTSLCYVRQASACFGVCWGCAQ